MLDDKNYDLEFTLYQFIIYTNIFVNELEHLKETIKKLNSKFKGIEFLRTETRFNRKLTWMFLDDQVKHIDGRVVADINYYFKDEFKPQVSKPKEYEEAKLNSKTPVGLKSVKLSNKNEEGTDFRKFK